MSKLIKMFFVIFSAIASTISFASVLTFQCISTDAQGVHRFDARGIVTVDDHNYVEGVMTLVTQKAQAEQSSHTFEEMRVSGKLYHFEQTGEQKETFDQLVLDSNIPYIKSVNLLLDYDDKISSRIFSIDNFSYRSNCKVIDGFNLR